jgi:cholesterol oxidase
VSILEGVGIQFEESMSGYLGVDETDPRKGAEIGKDRETPIRFDVQIFITDLSRFLKLSEREADLSGTITFEPLGGTFTIRDGRFNLFTLDPETGMRQMVYAFKFTAADGQTYFLYGHKEIHDDRGQLDLIEDMTRLFTTIYRGEDDQAPVYGAGELYFKLWGAPSLVASMKVLGAASIWQKVAAYTAFASFAYGALRDEYLKEVRLFYDTQYENLVLSGVLQGEDGPRPFFLVSGVHDKGFPWGDGETFWDVMLAIEDGNGDYQRYCITDRVLEGLHLDVERGTYHYRGPIFALETGYSASHSEMRSGANHLTECEANFEITFQAEPYEPVSFPFEVQGVFGKDVT